jgi:hypothetical protein
MLNGKSLPPHKFANIFAAIEDYVPHLIQSRWREKYNFPIYLGMGSKSE